MPPDPYYDWVLATKYLYYGTERLLPMLVERLPSPIDTRSGAVREKRGNLEDFVSMLHPREAVEALYAATKPHPDIQRFQICRAVKLGARKNALSSSSEKSKSTDGQVQEDVPKGDGADRGRIVVSGVIDDGIAFAHERFKFADGKSRVEWFWDQAQPPINPPQPWWDYGREYSKNGPGGIDDLLGKYADEDELYQKAGLTDHSQTGHKPVAWRAAHGTVVMDLACGGDQIHPRTTNPIVCVQLPVATTADTSGGTLAKHVYDAIDYILTRADKIAAANGKKTVPVVINLSYGLFAGPHDGTSILEAAMDKFIASRYSPNDKKSELCIVIPSGNAHLSRCHAYLCLDGGASRSLCWRVMPDDRTESFLEIWLPKFDEAGSPPRIEIGLATPTGESVVLQVGDAGYAWPPCPSGPPCPPVLCTLMRYTAAQTGSRELIRISLAPTVCPDGTLPVAPSGTWQVTVKNAGTVAVHGINAWIQRDDTPYGYPRRGRQSYFDDPEYRRLDDGGREIEDDNVPANTSDIRRNGLINAIATGSGPIVVGGFRRSDRRFAKYSASGPVVGPGRGGPSPNGPDAMAVSEDSVACQGVLGAGARSGSTVAMNGTSVAAPRLAREIVDYLIAHPNELVDRQMVFDWARATENPPLPPEVRAGGGRLKLSPVAPPAPLKRVDEP